MQGEPARVPSVSAQGKDPVIEQVCEPGPSVPPPEVIPEDGLDRVLLRIDSPPQMDDVRLVPLGFRAERGGEGPLLQAFDAEGESLLDDVEERRHLVSRFGELEEMAKHTNNLSVVL